MDGWHRKLMADNLATETAQTLALGRRAMVNYAVNTFVPGWAPGILFNALIRPVEVMTIFPV